MPGDFQLLDLRSAAVTSPTFMSVHSCSGELSYISSCFLIQSATSLWCLSSSKIVFQNVSTSSKDGGSLVSDCLFPSSR